MAKQPGKWWKKSPEVSESALTKLNKIMGRDLQCTIKQVKMLDSKAF